MIGYDGHYFELLHPSNKVSLGACQNILTHISKKRIDTALKILIETIEQDLREKKG